MKFLALLLIAFLILKAEVMLLKEYNDENLSGWLMSEKYDGVRAIWDGKSLKSRNAKIIKAPKWWLKDFPNFAIDGELWSGRGEFEFIGSVISSFDDKGWENIKFMIFDVPNAKGNLRDRLEVMREFLSQNSNEFIRVIEQIKIDSNEDAFAFLDEIVSGGGEGIVVRNENAPYKNGRSGEILKLKKFKDSECKVVKLQSGKGKFEGLLGSLICVDIFSNIEFKIGSGFSDEQRANPPKVGTIITYKYQNLTKYAKPRFPVFLRVKSDNNLTK
ncbi:DNA ligase [Campylobacter fetus subsp. venerealis]|uniref:DNA ligase n=1 Tax=Campylobacter fetus TaxID=196 RepID=UPI0018E81CBE|nr:DNA ligase [Campylobacter fetus]QQF52151.1 DNA ligase [Campylobacter fetus subsp. venerealis]